jgi:dTDP-4-amino-4,6-dideoxygalactose transaminase
MSRERFAEALRAEGIPVNVGYVEPLYRQPMYHRGVAFGAQGFPFRQPGREPVSYPDGLCPVTERIHQRELIYFTFCHAQVGRADLEDATNAIEKVASHAGTTVNA